MAWKDVELKSSGVKSHDPHKIPLAFKATVLKLRYGKKLPGRQSIEQALLQFPSLRLEKSYFTHSCSHIYRFRKEFERAAEKGDPDVVALCEKYGLEFRQWVEE
jgi:hypothetical protein